MYPISMSQLQQLVGVPPDGTSRGRQSVNGVSLDSRTVQPGDVFFALPGSRTHGARYISRAFERGATCVITDSSWRQSCDADIPIPAVIETSDPVTALWCLADWNRRQSDALVVAVTGSVGKTTTREMIAAVLSAGYRGTQSPENFNNQLGVPLSLVRLTPEHEFGVLELAARHTGEIASLAGLVRPEFGVVTRVAEAHLAGFGSLQGVQRAKQELVEAIPAGGTAFLNGDDPLVLSMSRATAGNVIRYGEDVGCHVRATEVRSHNDHLSFAVDGEAYRLRVTGRHQLSSALAAVAIGRETGLTAEQIRLGLSQFSPVGGRGSLATSRPWTVIDDTYNASPASVHAAVATMCQWTGCRHRILVLGDMLDLGSAAAALHYAAGCVIGRSLIDHVLLLGTHAEDVAAGFLSVCGQTGQNRVSVFHDHSLLTAMLDCIVTEGDLVLVKGSRGMKMEQIVRSLQELAATTELRSAA